MNTTDAVFIYRRTVAKLAGLIVVALTLASLSTSLFAPEGNTQFGRVLGFAAVTTLAFGIVLMNSASTMTRCALEDNALQESAAGEPEPKDSAPAPQFLPHWLHEAIR